LRCGYVSVEKVQDEYKGTTLECFGYDIEPHRRSFVAQESEWTTEKYEVCYRR